MSHIASQKRIECCFKSCVDKLAGYNRNFIDKTDLTPLFLLSSSTCVKLTRLLRYQKFNSIVTSPEMLTLSIKTSKTWSSQAEFQFEYKPKPGWASQVDTRLSARDTREFFKSNFNLYRSSCVKTGGPLCFVISASLWMPTISFAPNAFACRSAFACPKCTMS